MERIARYGWDNCYRLTNGTVELVVTGDVGPRIIAFGFCGGQNEFKVFDEHAGRTGGTDWRAYGGHRLWHAPEDAERTYVPDNDPVEVVAIPGGLRAVQPVEPRTGIRKEIEVTLGPAGAAAVVTHRLTNAGQRPVTLAPWALSVMAPGGVAVLPLPPHGPHPENLRPVGAVVTWAYTDFRDPRWTWGSRAVLLRQDPNRAAPQKAGLRGGPGWLAYARGGRLFVKTAEIQAGAEYADFGCARETFTNAAVLELETLGPQVRLAPGAGVTHRERWWLLRDVAPPQDEAGIVAVCARVAAECGRT
jgi:hypothetical protein